MASAEGQLKNLTNFEAYQSFRAYQNIDPLSSTDITEDEFDETRNNCDRSVLETAEEFEDNKIFIKEFIDENGKTWNIDSFHPDMNSDSYTTIEENPVVKSEFEDDKCDINNFIIEDDERDLHSGSAVKGVCYITSTEDCRSETFTVNDETDESEDSKSSIEHLDDMERHVTLREEFPENCVNVPVKVKRKHQESLQKTKDQESLLKRNRNNRQHHGGYKNTPMSQVNGVDFSENSDSVISLCKVRCKLKTMRNRCRSKDKKFKCSMCNFTTPHVNFLKAHIDLAHQKAEEEKELERSEESNLEGRLSDGTTFDEDSTRELADFVHSKTLFKAWIKVRTGTVISYHCSECKFDTNIEQHIRRHVDKFHFNTPRKCYFCDFEASDKNSLRKHIIVAHLKLMVELGIEDVKSFHCVECDFETDIEENLRNHIDTVHLNATRKCGFCDFETTLNMLQLHICTFHSKNDLPKHSILEEHSYAFLSEKAGEKFEVFASEIYFSTRQKRMKNPKWLLPPNFSIHLKKKSYGSNEEHSYYAAVECVIFIPECFKKKTRQEVTIQDMNSTNYTTWKITNGCFIRDLNENY